MTNRYGDIELDARGMRVLTHPVRLALLRQLQHDGPSTASRLAEAAGTSPSGASWHLRQLAAHGLVRDSDAVHRREHGRERGWEASAGGFRFSPDDTGASTQAAAALAAMMEAADGDVFQRWRSETESRLEPTWRRRAARSNTILLLTPEELDRLRADMEQLLAPYVVRKYTPREEHPSGARRVRLLRLFLPEAPAPRPEN